LQQDLWCLNRVTNTCTLTFFNTFIYLKKKRVNKQSYNLSKITIQYKYNFFQINDTKKKKKKKGQL